MSLPQIITATIETAFNQYLQLDPNAPAMFEKMEGKVIAIEVLGLKQSLYLFPSVQGMMIMSDFDGEADTTISGSPVALAKLSVLNNPAGVLFNAEVKISGDVRLGSQFKKILSQINIDWEEILSQFTGDMVAHKTGNLMRSFSGWLERSKNSMYTDAGDYLTEESLISPSKAEINHFIKNVDKLRQDSDRLQARIKNAFLKSRSS